MTLGFRWCARWAGFALLLANALSQPPPLAAQRAPGLIYAEVQFRTGIFRIIRSGDSVRLHVTTRTTHGGCEVSWRATSPELPAIATALEQIAAHPMDRRRDYSWDCGTSGTFTAIAEPDSVGIRWSERGRSGYWLSRPRARLVDLRMVARAIRAAVAGTDLWTPPPPRPDSLPWLVVLR